ncbi:MAG: amino acid dehydrogenase, partial [Hyphomonas sp.]|nr:amino acid dehydrogenase [Hyphomonas sp.]
KSDKSPELFRAFGRAVESLQGRYYTAEDVGVDVADMAIVREETRFVAGLDEGTAASGDPSPVTAKGVYLGIREVARRLFGTDDLNGRTIAVQGVGSVGGYTCDHLAKAGAHLIITDIDQDALAAVAARTGARIVAPNDIYDAEADIFSPNALGAIINEKTLARLKVKGIAGGANNQLVVPEMGEFLRRKGILYAPDYVINGGGIINVAAEISGSYSRDWVEATLARLIVTLGEVLDEAIETGQPTNYVADRIARARIASARATR